MIDRTKVTSALRASKLKVKSFDRQGLWSVVFKVDGGTKTVFLFVPNDGEYFVAIAPLLSKRLEGKLETIAADTLRVIMRASSDTMLAKVEYIDTPESTGFVTVSECSVEGFTGKKLHRRLEACAKLALKIEDALLTDKS